MPDESVQLPWVADGTGCVQQLIPKASPQLFFRWDSGFSHPQDHCQVGTSLLHSKAKRNKSLLRSPENFPEPCSMRLCRMLTKSRDTGSSREMKFFMASGAITSWFRASRSFFQAPDFLRKHRPSGPHGHKLQPPQTQRGLTGPSQEAEPQFRVQHSYLPALTSS